MAKTRSSDDRDALAIAAYPANEEKLRISYSATIRLNHCDIIKSRNDSPAAAGKRFASVAVEMYRERRRFDPWRLAHRERQPLLCGLIRARRRAEEDI